MIRRALPFLPLFLLGCGGDAPRTSATPADAGQLKDAVLDLAVVGAGTPPAGAMRGTGTAYGTVRVSVHVLSPNETVLGVVASLSTIENRRGLNQLLRFFPTFAGPLAVGTRVEFGPKENTVDYDESRYPLSLAQGQDGTHVGWGASDETQGGTLEVTALEGGRITLRLTGVRLTRSGGDPITIDGTISGALTTE